MKAAQRNHIAAMEVLLQRGADVNQVCSSGETALVKAKRMEHADAVALLIKNGAADLEVPPEKDYTNGSIPGYKLKPVPDAARPETLYLIKEYREQEEAEKARKEKELKEAHEFMEEQSINRPPVQAYKPMKGMMSPRPRACPPGMPVMG